jgi:ABC-type transport system involved in multi-copper enzyme maturation permease subunit
VVTVRSELLKVRSLPTPRWCAIVVFATLIIGVAATWKWGLGPDRDAYDLSIGIPASIASTVFGVWLFGVEFGEGTMRRTLTADPRRGRLFFSKLATGILVLVAATAVLYVIAFPLYDLAADRHGQSIALAGYGDTVLAALVFNVAFMLVGAAFAAISASMSGGITLALVFIFIIGIGLTAIPSIERYTFLVTLGDINTAILGPDPGSAAAAQENGTGTSVAITLAWLLGLLGLGWLRLWRSEIK